MLLGTPKIWWIAAGALFVAGLALVATDVGGTLGNVVGVVGIIAAMVVFAAAPMRYGRPKPGSAPAPEAPAMPPVAPLAPEPTPPRPRANIEAKDASEV